MYCPCSGGHGFEPWSGRTCDANGGPTSVFVMREQIYIYIYISFE